MSRRVLVTGGAGFLGAALVRELLEAGHEVTVLDDASRGSFERLAELRAGPHGARLHERPGSVLDAGAVDEAVRGQEVVQHLAAINGTRNFYERPREVFEVAARGTLHVADAARRHRVRRVLLASSSEVYHDPPVVPTPEQVPLVLPDLSNPRFSYAGGKVVTELVGRHLLGGDGPECVTFRPHNVYGPCMGFEHVVPNLVEKLRRAFDAAPVPAGPTGGAERVEWARSADGASFPSLELELMGDGSETRAFCYVDDAARAIALLGEKGEAGGTYHVGVEVETKIADLARTLARVLGLRVHLRAGPPAPGAPSRRCPATARIRALGFEARVSLEEGLRRSAAWYFDRIR